MADGSVANDIGIVIVNYRSWLYVIEAVESIRRSDDTRYRIVIVDNASPDDSLARLSVLYDVELVAHPVNGGWASGCNVGIRAAEKLGIRTFLLLNPDATLRPATLSALRAALGKAGRLCAMSAVVRDKDDGTLQFAGADPDPRTGLPLWRRDDDAALPAGVDLVASGFLFGAAMLLTSEALARVGFLEESYFLNFDEADWCGRARALSVPCFIASRAVVDHVGNVTIGGGASPAQTYYMTRNALLFAHRFSSGPQRRRLLWDTVHTIYVRSGWRTRLRRGDKDSSVDPATARAFLLGLADYLRGHRGPAPRAVVRSRGAAQQPA